MGSDPKDKEGAASHPRGASAALALARIDELPQTNASPVKRTAGSA